MEGGLSFFVDFFYTTLINITSQQNKKVYVVKNPKQLISRHENYYSI